MCVVNPFKVIVGEYGEDRMEERERFMKGGGEGRIKVFDNEEEGNNEVRLGIFKGGKTS